MDATGSDTELVGKEQKIPWQMITHRIQSPVIRCQVRYMFMFTDPNLVKMLPVISSNAKRLVGCQSVFMTLNWGQDVWQGVIELLKALLSFLQSRRMHVHIYHSGNTVSQRTTTLDLLNFSHSDHVTSQLNLACCLLCTPLCANLLLNITCGILTSSTVLQHRCSKHHTAFRHIL